MAGGGRSRSKRGISSDPLGDLLDNLKQNPIPGLFTSSATDNCVVLCDWWLVRLYGEGESKNLAVSGYTGRKQGEIPFTSAPIVKRHDSWTVEAADGVTVKVEGMINQTNTQNNGFSHEVCQQFTVGFPFLWKQYVDYCVDSTPSSAASPIAINDKPFGDSSGNGDKGSEQQHEDGLISTDGMEAEGFATREKDAEEFATPEKDAEEFATPEKDAEEFPTPEKDDTSSDKKFSTAGRIKTAVSKSKMSDMSLDSGKGSKKKDHAPQSRDKTRGRGRPRANLQQRSAAISPTSSESNIRRTRSGRAVIPMIDKGSQKVVYDQDGNFAGIASTTSVSKGSTSKPGTKKKRI